MKKILVVNINWLGDAVFSIPVFSNLRRAYPQATISCLCVPRLKDVLAQCASIDEIIIYDEKGKDRWPWRQAALLLKLRRQGFDAAFLLHRSISRAFLVWCAGIGTRIGFTKSALWLTHPVEFPPDHMHRSDGYLTILEKTGIPVTDRLCVLDVSSRQTADLCQFLQQQGYGTERGYIVLNTGGNWDLKRWPIGSWAALAKRLSAEMPYEIIFSGSGEDRSQVNQIILDSGIKALNCAGETDLGRLLALFQGAKAMISADSGPLHLANSVGAHVVGIFGPTRYEITGPRGSGRKEICFKDMGCNKAPCYHLSCAQNVCMQTIGVDDVFKAIQRITRP